MRETTPGERVPRLKSRKWFEVLKIVTSVMALAFVLERCAYTAPGIALAQLVPRGVWDWYFACLVPEHVDGDAADDAAALAITIACLLLSVATVALARIALSNVHKSSI